MTGRAEGGFFRAGDAAVDLFVRLTPKSVCDAIEGVQPRHDGRSHLRARVRAVPAKGRANTALEKLLAGAFGVPASDVAVVAGGASRHKTVRLTGDPAVILRRLMEIAGE